MLCSATRRRPCCCRGHSLALEPTEIEQVDGLRLTCAVRTWMDLASQLDVPDLVAAGDFLAGQGLASPHELMAATNAWDRRRGARRLREAAALLDGRSESRPESHLRVMLVRAGLGPLAINHTLIHSETGRRIRPDFSFPEARFIIEYQGDYHRTRSQWRSDMTRRSRLELEGWKVMEVNADDLRAPDELGQRRAKKARSRTARCRSSCR